MIEEDDNNEPLGMLVLVKGHDAAGEAHYAYAAIPYEKYEAFQQAQAAGAHDLSQFGAVLCHGPGLEPSAEIQKKMEEEHGAMHDFARQIAEAIKPEDA